MSAFLKVLESAPLLADGAIGSYLFEQTGRLSEINHVYESLNLDQPDLVRQLHFAYLQAGARCLTTNTFAANATHLAPMGQGDRVVELNRAAVALARQSINTFRKQSQTDAPFFVLGSIGPTNDSDKSPSQIKEIYRQPVQTLADEKVDALLIETFTNLPHVIALLELVRELDSAPPVIVQMSLRQTGLGAAWEQDPAAYVHEAAALGSAVIGVNCCAPWEAIAFIDAVQHIPAVKQERVRLSAMPNAGGSQRIGNRYMTHVNPEYMGKLARTLAERGVRLIGGCCEVHPPHISEMDNYLTAHEAGHTTTATVSLVAQQPADDGQKKSNGPFSNKIKTGEFAVSVEVLPARGTAPKTLQNKIDFVAQLASSGLADALDVTDGSRGIPLMPPSAFIALVRERLDWTVQSGDSLELIPHLTTRDLNVMGLQSRLIGYWAQRIHNILIITGDPPKMSPTYPRSTAVFDLDSTQLIRYTHTCLNSGVDFGGQPLGKHNDPRTHFTIGTGFDPEAVNCKHELEKLRRKIDNGADYIMTQPAFRAEPLNVLESFRDQVPVLVGVMILAGLDHARKVGQVPGVTIPTSVYDRLAAHANAEDQQMTGRDIAVEQVRWAKQQDWAGLYLMSPASHQPVIDVLQAGLS